MFHQTVAQDYQDLQTILKKEEGIDVPVEEAERAGRNVLTLFNVIRKYENK